MLGLGHKKLYSEGALTEGLVVHRSDTADGINYHLTIRVRFPDGTTTEFKKWLDWHDVGEFTVGSVLPVRYDRSDHSKVVLDVPALEERHAKTAAAQTAELDAQTARLGEPSFEHPGSAVDLSSGSSRPASDPLDRLTKLADLKERGALSDDEFAAEKAKILGESSP
jgi:Short C-terminal domain